MPQLRPYQQDVADQIYAAWAAGQRNVLAQMATGAGKTVLFSDILQRHVGYAVAIAHRVELVSQISLTLARYGVRHRVIASAAAVRNISSIHMAELGRNYIDPHGRITVAGVDTLIRMPADDPLFRLATLVVIDEGHHVTATNKWGTAMQMFPNAVGLLPTATPLRADGKGLGRHADGIVDVMVEGPSMRDLINQGFLCDYRIFAPRSDVDYSDVPVTASGDFSPEKLRKAVHRSTRIVGDVVESYLKFAPGEQGASFHVDVEAATEQAAAFRAAGIAAEVIHGGTPDLLRSKIMRDYRAGLVRYICSVDILGEGVDVPVMGVVSFVRKTMSFGLYAQQFGRPLRLAPGKTKAIIIDHVGNVQHHGLPDAPRVWSLDRRERRSRSGPSDVMPTKTCAKCESVYEAFHVLCPYCGAEQEPVGRSSPELVDGLLYELDPDTLAIMRGEIDKPLVLPYGATAEIAGRLAKVHKEKREAQAELRSSMALWAGWRTHQGESLAQSMKRFYLTFGVDVLTAQALSRKDAEQLRAKIQETLTLNRVEQA